MELAQNNFTANTVETQLWAYSIKLSQDDFIHLSSEKIRSLLGIHSREWNTFSDSWNDLKEDTCMADGGSYRLRRHGVFSATHNGGAIQAEPAQPHYQTTKFNQLNGGIERHFEPISSAVKDSPVMKAILNFCSQTFGKISPLNNWHIEVHQFRILAQESGGKPTPEGMHQDGVDYVMMMLIARSGVTGGTTTIQDMNGNRVAQFTLKKPLEAALVNDLRVAHGVTPVLPENNFSEKYRDMLVVTFKRK